MDLFEFTAQTKPKNPALTPLAEILRPQDFTQLFGREKANNFLNSISKTERYKSVIVWGPPGSGKTSFAQLLKKNFPGDWRDYLASELTVKDIRGLTETARINLAMEGKQTILFLDEIHRLNRSHQDALLPAVETGSLVLVGATTEHPFAALNKALLSRCQIIEFQSLSSSQLVSIFDRIQDILEKRFSENWKENWLSQELLSFLVKRSQGDARVFIGEIEALWDWKQSHPDRAVELEKSPEFLNEVLGAHRSSFDPGARDHSVAISGLIKCMRSSQPQKAVAWLAHMLSGGEDLLFINRRLMIFASEDIGNADPRAIQVAVSAAQAVERVGLPEARIILSQAVLYLASAPKSRATYTAIGSAMDWVESQPLSSLQAALHPESDSQLPEFYIPTEIGFEKNITQYLEWQKNRNKK